MDQSLLKFPCDFPIKIIGLTSDEFEAQVYAIIRKHVPNFSDTMIQTRTSKNKKYSSISVTVHVDSKAQLDELYQALTASPHILVVL